MEKEVCVWCDKEFPIDELSYEDVGLLCPSCCEEYCEEGRKWEEMIDALNVVYNLAEEVGMHPTDIILPHLKQHYPNYNWRL